MPETCPRCKTEIIPREVWFGRVGKMVMEACECEASRFVLKYENTGKPDNVEDIFIEGL